MSIPVLTKTFLRDLVRQKTIIFSSFILPVVIIWSTWWVTADLPMEFKLDSEKFISASMIDVHVVTGGLTAMAITAGLFGFIITADYQSISRRLRQVGYSSFIINTSVVVSLLVVLMFTSVVAIFLSSYLASGESNTGLAVSIILVTLIYAALGNLIGSIFPNITAGSLFILIFSFMDLMIFTNPMGEGLYLQNWTYYTPGFWPVQIALEAGFVGMPDNLATLVLQGLGYFVFLLALSLLMRKLGLKLELMS